MGIKERKEREKNTHRELILISADKIIKGEGLDKLSIRKIASDIEYSPAIIYHYFHDKEEIINTIIKRNYEKIIRTLSSLQVSEYKPEDKIKYSLEKYIQLALEMPEEYKTILLNNSTEVLKHTSLLFEGASVKRKALNILYESLKEIYMDKSLGDNFIELTAQIIWTSTFGLILKLIIEKDIPSEQRKLLIHHHISLMVEGIILRKTIN
ncbi:transcriptional regulator, TetR family [Clostridium pasteurianum DSM 525 = ATCC 6013]|uniref:Transcriptional regulator, TetR family n=1 Tax=Clostridium pasteurianum DSM 525 = ATCC 6013 TaxID=1262449 RepID=A0A0H3J3H5_CLOPA|nr:TetR/AcrR family transcriptional regulator [Clostridium pasteurianum]AJA46463.1 transcriptional regulator, TetR family [Clostridium pasteurianum DSM 525 = ATCC 6013]AJA50451.1 transcriptional regulator, TetR family [Clostridium pasteurianum DSM 525 = ATCC 6013]AOZ73893.1 transcriptional regulator [Clostridium pasteurianum DSM 525 = ATCC 6013]AOZ77690.1 transcriptional regulator [Clostridium pasteurianum]ELP61037.1 TetR family transcriptional regulator [Clostridium pasteurianum DSM 525 = ATC